jgi:hypothetical protein
MMDSEAFPDNRLLKLNQTATNEFQRSGKLPKLSLIKNQGTGGVSVSWLGEDCENGMRRTIYKIPLVKSQNQK